MGFKEQKVIDEIKEYLINFDHEKFYGTYTYMDQEYHASNLLFSLLISETLGIPFKYYEDISSSMFEKEVGRIMLSDYKNKKLAESVIVLLKEILDINSYIVKMNTTTFSYHDILSKAVDVSDIKERIKSEANDDMRHSLKLVDQAETDTLQRFRDVHSPFARLIDSKARGNKKQIAQEFMAIGYKVDSKSNILKKPILSSFFEGLSSIDEMYIAAVGCRNAIIQGTNSVADSGYLNRKLSFGSVDISLSEEKDCKSNTYLEVNINKSNMNTILNGRYILDEETNKLKLIRPADTSNYIGKKVKLRSPATCCSKDGICKTCYGILSEFNIGLSIGLLAATTIAEIATQRLLSTKHLLYAAIFGDNETIMQYINISHNDNQITAIKPFNILINNLGKMFVVTESEKIEYEHNFKNLTISKNPEYEDENGNIYYKFDEGEVVFTNIKEYLCSDMNALLKRLKAVFDKQTYMSDVNDLNEYFKHMFEVVMELGKVPSVHIEVVFSQMIKVLGKNNLLWSI